MLKIGSRVYAQPNMDDINLRDLLRFDVEVAELGLSKTWGDVERIQADLDGLDEAGRARHPERLFMVAAMVWLARRTAGEDVTFSEAVDIRIEDVAVLPDPEDRKSPKAKGGKKSHSVDQADPDLKG
jgi:hypothetical protein